MINLSHDASQNRIGMSAKKTDRKPLEELIFDALGKARAEKLDKKLPKEEWLAVVRQVIKNDAKASRGPKIGLGAGLSDDEWLMYLKNHELLIGVEVEDEVRRCRLYFAGKCDPSRTRLVKWLSRADKKSGTSGVKRIAAHLTPDTEPLSEWRGVAGRVLPDCDLLDRIRDGLPWLDIPRHVREKIIAAL